MYDVLHDNIYRKTWDPAMLESFEIARLAPNADVGYYSCESSHTSQFITRMILLMNLYLLYALCTCGISAGTGLHFSLQSTCVM